MAHGKPGSVDPGQGRRTISIQLVIVAGLVAWLKVYLPRSERRKAAAEAAERERKIEAFFANMVIEDAREVAGPDGETLHPQRLRATLSSSEVEQVLGAPRISNPDFRGGQHLTWIGTTHRLEAAFNKGRLYSLRIEDLRTEHGTVVFESSAYWQAF